MQLKAVAFDLDGTLYPNSILYFRVIPLFLRHPVIFRRFGRVRRQIRKIRPIEDFYTLQAEMFAKEMKIDNTTAKKMIREIIYPTWEAILGEADLFPGVRETLDELRNMGIKLGILSDFPVQKKLELLNVQVDWDYAYSSEEVGYLKPNPEPFCHLAESLSLDPASIIYVGNHFEYDITGASKVGMKTAYLHKTETSTLPDITFYDYTEFIPKLKTANFL